MTLLAGLNAPQRAAVTAPPGPILVLAGPGSGKTRVLTHRIAYLIDELGIPPWQIMAVTFTNTAAREMGARVEALLGERPRGLTMGTFHATCARLLRREGENLPGYSANFVIFDSDDQKQVIKQALQDLNLDDKRFPAGKMHGAIGSAKNEMITPEMYAASTYIAEVTRRVYVRYQEILVANDAMDFDDLLLNTVLLLDDRPDLLEKYQERYRHLLVDEFQDTNTAQYALLTRLAAAHGNILVVGDADQSIYKWRGADFRNINRFREEFPGAQTILLEQNYRSTQVILDAAKAVIRRNQDRVDKDLFTERSGGAQIEVAEAYNETEEAQNILATIQRLERSGYSPGAFAIMYRTNAQSRAIEEAFLREGMPYLLVGATRFYSRREIKDVIAYLRLIHNPLDAVSFQRVINTPTRGIGKKTQQTLSAWAAGRSMQPGHAVMALANDPEIQHPFNGRAFKALSTFGGMLTAWTRLNGAVSVRQLLEAVLDQIDYRIYLDEDKKDDNDRWANVQELISVAGLDEEMPLADFLEQVALVSDIDDLEEWQEAPTLLTLHAAKGLEFPVVFITGLEEGVLPHSRALEDAEELAEERRLFYVGLTRAQDRVYLSHAFRRTTYGMADVGTPSRFLGDVPEELVTGGSSGYRRQQAKRRASSWSWSRDEDDDNGRPRRSAPSRESAAEKRPARRRGRGSTEWQRGEVSPAQRRDEQRGGPRTRRHIPPAAAQPAPEPEPVAAVPRYSVGQKVRHARFGDGIVVEAKPTGADTEVTVAFVSVGIKRLAASFAKLDLVE